MIMRKVVGPIVAMLVLGATLVAPTVAQTPQTSVTVDSKVSPNRAGTPGKPQGVKLTGQIKWQSEEGIEPPIITAFDIFIAKGGLYNGGKYPKCAAAVANRNGPQACPKKSIMGSARGVAFADTEITRPKVTFINGGARNICFYTVLTNPARVETCVPGKVTKLRGNKKWGYRLQIRVPEVLQVVAGVPIALREIRFEAGGRKWAKDWLATTSCPRNRKWGFQVETSYLYNDGSTSSSQYADSVACKPAK
jgi:hypothetical protein